MLLSHAAGWSGMAGGQCLDIEAEGKELSLTELEELHAAKTGALIQSSLVIGGYWLRSTPATKTGIAEAVWRPDWPGFSGGRRHTRCDRTSSEPWANLQALTKP